MIGEISLYGVYVPWLLVLFLLALVITRVLAWGFAQLGWYRLVWHPPLFDAAMFVLVLGALVFFSSSGLH